MYSVLDAAINCISGDQLTVLCKCMLFLVFFSCICHRGGVARGLYHTVPTISLDSPQDYSFNGRHNIISILKENSTLLDLENAITCF